MMLVYVWVGIIILWFSLTGVLMIDLRIAWKFRLMPALKARQMYAQDIMMILSYIIGAGWGVCAFILIRDDDTELKMPRWLLLWMTFGYFASMNIYFYRVWILYYKYKLQNEFAKVMLTSKTQTQNPILSHILALTSSGSSSKTNSRNFVENEQTEKLIKQYRQQSVRKSWFVRYRYTLGRSMVTKAFWFLMWIFECIVAFWSYKTNESSVWWSPKKLADECFIVFAWIMCFVVLFLYPSDDLFLIKIELRLIFFITTLEIVVYYNCLNFMGIIVAYLSISIYHLCIMVAMSFSNYRALGNKCWCFLSPIIRHVRSSQDFDANSQCELNMMDVLESKSLSQAFERHLKREFSLENLNFIITLVHYKRLCLERKKSWEENKCIVDEKTHADVMPRMISMQPVSLPLAKTTKDISIDSTSSTPGTKTVGILTDKVDSTLSNSSSLRLPVFSPKLPVKRKESERLSKLAPRLNWIQSEIEDWSDMKDTALFIFNEYCDRGSPQEINIPRQERAELIEFFSDSSQNHNGLSSIFDPAFDTVLDLLESDSMRRFRRNSSFRKLMRK